MPIQAELAFAESGINPMQVDPKRFRARCLRRIEQNRTWVVVEDDRLIFKADVVSKTAPIVYLEGIWTRDDRRNNGDSVKFMNELSHKLLDVTKSICLLVNEVNKPAQSFYRKCGFLFRATYETIFLPRKEFLRN
jgi:predicted GNAT family acetyltransferase